MGKKNKSDYLTDFIEHQKHILNPGYYIGTGRIPPDVSAPGNPKPLAVSYFIDAAFFLAFGLFLLFSDIDVTSGGFIKSPIINKIIFFLFMVGISAFNLLLGFRYLQKSRKKHKATKNNVRSRKKRRKK